MRPRVLVLTAGFGEGHNAAARALAEAFDSRHGLGTARIADVFATASPRINAAARALYLGLINPNAAGGRNQRRCLDGRVGREKGKGGGSEGGSAQHGKPKSPHAPSPAPRGSGEPPAARGVR